MKREKLEQDRSERHERAAKDGGADFQNVQLKQHSQKNAEKLHAALLNLKAQQSTNQASSAATDFIQSMITQSKKGTVRFGSPGANSKSPSESRDQSPSIKKMNFLKEMKRHGIMKALNDINKFNEFFETSPTRKEESIDASETLKSDLSVRHDTKKETLIDSKQVEESELSFVFPFQRRARSLSPSKPSLINSIGNTSINQG